MATRSAETAVDIAGPAGAAATLAHLFAADEYSQVGVELDSALVVGRKRSPTGKAVFGSITQDVLLNSPRPVRSVRRVRSVPFEPARLQPKYAASRSAASSARGVTTAKRSHSLREPPKASPGMPATPASSISRSVFSSVPG